MDHNVQLSMLELAPFAVWALDQDQKVIVLNPKARSLGATPFDFLTSEQKAQFQNKLQLKDLTDIVFKLEGSEATSWFQFQLVVNDNGFLVYAVDVTQHKEHVQGLNQILDAIPDMVLVKGENSKLLWANSAFQKYYGMSNEELRNLIDAPFVKPDLTEQYVADDEWVWNNQKSMIIENEPVVRFDGEIRRFQTIKTPIIDQHGNTKVTVGISRDITEQIQFQEKSVTSAKMASLGEMAAGIAHEINNPLAIILGQANLMQRILSLKNASAGKVLSSVNMIITQSFRISKIIEGLKNFSQLGDKIPVREIILIDLVNETLTFCTSRLNLKQITLRVEVPGNLKFHGKSVPIAQIILNLLNNAIDAISNLPTRWISIEAVEKEDSVELRLIDSGRGIPPTLENKIFEPFFTTKEVGKGTGLGLSISSSLAKQHGGSLTLERSTSASCFLLRIPKTYRAN